jgi:D-galactonate transporter
MGGGFSLDRVGSNKSKVRWFVLGIICIMYLVTYMDRTNISVAAPQIGKEFGFDKITMGVIFSAFTWAYAIGQVPGGWLGDRFGPRNVLSIIVSYWSIFTIVTAQAAGYLSFLVIRFLFGLGEAGAFPTATRAMQLWFPKSERGFVQGITHSFSRFGAAIVPPLAVAIMVSMGWRSVFYIFGAIGIIWSLLFFFVYRNIPEEHRWVNKAELTHIRGLDEKGNINQPIDIKKRPQVPWKTLLSSANMWYIMIAYFCYCYCLYFYMTWLPSYLVDYRHFSLKTMGWLASLPLFAGVIGDTVGGIVTDKLLEKTKNMNFARKVVAIPSLLGAAIFMIPAAATPDPYTAVYCLAGSLFFLECVIGPAWAVPMDVGGEYSGTVSGMMNMAGNFGSALSPIVFGALVQGGSWTAPFYVQAALLVVGALVWLFFLNPEKSVVEKNTLVGDKKSPTIAG